MSLGGEGKILKKKSNLRFDLTIVIPAYAEERRIGKTLDELAEYLQSKGVFRNKTVEVLVVSADSNDKTHQIVLAKQKKFSHMTLLKPGTKVGKGRDVQFGMLRAKGKVVIFMDADLATPLSYLPIFLENIEQGADIVIGIRNLKKHHKNFIRRSISRIGNLLFLLAGGVDIQDSQCGFKMFTHNAATLCFSKMTIQRWGFDMEILVIAKSNGLNIATQNIYDWQDVPQGSVSSNIIKTALYTLNDLLVILINRARGVY